MWINPNHPDPPRRPDAPRDEGERLATFPRGQRQEFRVSLAEYEGHQFVSLRVWSQGWDGAWWPVKNKGLSVKLREVRDLADVLAALADQLGIRTDAEPGRNGGERRGFEKYRDARSNDESFDEFGAD